MSKNQQKPKTRERIKSMVTTCLALVVNFKNCVVTEVWAWRQREDRAP